MRTSIWQAALLPMLFAVPGSAAILDSFGPATAMAGGSITVTFIRGGPVTVPIVADGFIGSGFGLLPGFFHFEVKGDTFTNEWKLENMSDTDVIIGAVIDLRGSHSVFDNGIGPSTPDSGLGLLGAEHVAGPGISASFESVPWPDPSNLGDAFMVETILFDGIGPAGGFTTWNDDTDRVSDVPEPGTWILCIAGLAAAARFRKRSA